MGDAIVLAALVAVIGLAVRSLVKSRKRGGCAGCSGNCGCCGGNCQK